MKIKAGWLRLQSAAVKWEMNTPTGGLRLFVTGHHTGKNYEAWP